MAKTPFQSRHEQLKRYFSHPPYTTNLGEGLKLKLFFWKITPSTSYLSVDQTYDNCLFVLACNMWLDVKFVYLLWYFSDIKFLGLSVIDCFDPWMHVFGY